MFQTPVFGAGAAPEHQERGQLCWLLPRGLTAQHLGRPPGRPPTGHLVTRRNRSPHRKNAANPKNGLVCEKTGLSRT